jgi:ArsR family transcriptional regulator, arsenate/arsenite/antimonite-responsive transcriptional repressor / arsenate reductase (thioredoxin)
VTRHFDLDTRVARHAALGDPIRLAIVDELAVSDRGPIELGDMLGVASNLLAHHLDVLERVGLITRTRSSGDGRRRYVQLCRGGLRSTALNRSAARGRALFVCTRNSARSQLAAAMWTMLTREPAASAGTDPADRVHPGAIAAAERAGLPLRPTAPRRLSDVRNRPKLVVTVCDHAREELEPQPRWWHWSIPDPVPAGTKTAFDRVIIDLRDRIGVLLDADNEPM